MAEGKKDALINWRQALSLVLDHVPHSQPVRLPIAQSCGFVAAESVCAPCDLPFFTSSALDGFAVRTTDIQGASKDRPVSLRVAGESKAGAPFQGEVEAGWAVEIMTGAPVPKGANAIVKVEDVQRPSKTEVVITNPVPPGVGIRPAGRDVQQGQSVLCAGDVLTPGRIALLAALGLGEVLVWPRPDASVIVTGDELVDAESSRFGLELGMIYDANLPMLTALLTEMGANVVASFRCSDNPNEIRSAMVRAAQASHIIVLSGGVSMGRYDFVREVVHELGGHTVFWGVNQQPGKPLFLATLGDVMVFGLPGNPVSAYFCADVYVRAVVRRFLGHSSPSPMEIMVLAGEDFCKSDPRPAFRRARIVAEERSHFVRATGPADSHLIHTIAAHHGYVVIGAERARIRRGEPVMFLLPNPNRLENDTLKTLLAHL